MSEIAVPESEPLLTPREVAELFGVDSKTVNRWGDRERLEIVRTPGGHRRYRAREVVELLVPPERVAAFLEQLVQSRRKEK